MKNKVDQNFIHLHGELRHKTELHLRVEYLVLVEVYHFIDPLKGLELLCLISLPFS